MIKLGFTYLTSLLLLGCAGVGVIESSDPLVKLEDSRYLFIYQNRPLIAERLIVEAMEIYEANEDLRGLGHSNRQYAEFLTSDAVSYHEVHYKKHGFWDQSITFENRNQKANDYYSIALEYYKRVIPDLEAQLSYDAATNVYYNMFYISSKLGRNEDACEFLDHVLVAYANNIAQVADAEPILPEGETSVPDLVSKHKQEHSCVGST